MSAPIGLHSRTQSSPELDHIGRVAVAMMALLAGTLSTTSVAAEPSELPPQFSQNYGQTETPRSAGLAGAANGLGSGISAPLFNPANMGIARTYHIGALAQFTPESARQLYGGAIVDSTRRWAGGVAVLGGFMDPDGIDRSQIDVRLALAFAVSSRFHIGLAGRYLNLDQEGLGPLGDSRASGGLLDTEAEEPGREALVSTITFDAGMTVRATEALHLSIFGKNLSYPNNGLSPTIVGGAIGYGTKDISIEIDGLADFNSYSKISQRFMAGGEYLIADRVPLRVGYRFDMMAGSGFSHSHQVGGGIGYVEPRFSVEASVRRTVSGPSATNIIVGVSYFLESLGLPVQQY